MSETGVIKFHYESNGCALKSFAGLKKVNATRDTLRQMGLVGVDEQGVSFGNVSLRDGQSFYITGSGTGHLLSLGRRNFSRVVAWDFDRNWLRCEGAAPPSAESLTHAAIYMADREVCVVAHGHDAKLWHRLLDHGFKTSPEAAYGTPAMAREVKRLFRASDVRRRKLFAMAGHENGVIAFGRDFAEALESLRNLGKD